MKAAKKSLFSNSDLFRRRCTNVAPSEMSARPGTADGRNKLLFLQQLPNQSRLPSIHGLIRENTRPLSSL